MIKIFQLGLVAFIVLSFFPILYAQEGMPPANVVVTEVSTDMIAPESEFIGTVYYQEVSDIASEVNGVVEVVSFEEGQRIKKGDVLVKLGADLLKKTLQATRATYEQVISDLEKAEKDLKRAESLYREELLSEQSYDEQRFAVKSLEKKSASLMADVQRLEIELQKKNITTPYDGVVIKKHIARGEWLSPGSIVATIARDDLVDIITEVPERVIRHIKRDMDIVVKVAGKEIMGKVVAIIPKGDISTRTVPVKIRAKNSLSLIEGMEARVSLPVDEKRKSFIVPRDAVITAFGMTVVFSVKDSKAMMIPIKVIGYKGLSAGIYAEGLKEGMKIVTKGNERLRDGQPVKITDESQAPSTK